MTNLKTGIIGLGAYVPDRIMTNDEWSEHLDTSDEWITDRTGIKTRRFAAADQTTVDLAAEAAWRALADAGLEIGDIDEIIVATDTPEVLIPDTAPYLQHRLGAHEVPTYDLAGSGCAGFVLALDIAQSRSAQDGRGALVGVELLTRQMNWHDLPPAYSSVTRRGSRRGTRSRRHRMLSFTAGTDGSQAEILGLEMGGTRSRLPLTAPNAVITKKSS